MSAPNTSPAAPPTSLSSSIEPGHLRHTAAQQLVFGERDGRRSDRLVAFEEAGARAGFRRKASTEVEADLWVKFVRLVDVERHDRGDAIADGGVARQPGDCSR